MLLICQRHGIKTVAEGVERPDQLAFLREHGCDAIQGDLLAPAMPKLTSICSLSAKRDAFA